MEGDDDVNRNDDDDNNNNLDANPCCRRTSSSVVVVDIIFCIDLSSFILYICMSIMMMIEVLGVICSYLPWLLGKYRRHWAYSNHQGWVGFVGFWGWNLDVPISVSTSSLTVRKLEQWNELVDWSTGTGMTTNTALVSGSTSYAVRVWLMTCTPASEKWRHEVGSPCVDTRLATSQPGHSHLGKYSFPTSYVRFWFFLWWFFIGFVSRLYYINTTQNIHTYTCITPNQRVTRS